MPQLGLRERLGITLLLQQDRPTAVEEELLHADVLSVRGAVGSTLNPGSSRVNKVALATERRCFHKAASGVNPQQARIYGHEAFGVLINESAAWLVAKALGPPFTEWVPTTVIRSIWPADVSLAGGFGALSTEIRGATDVEPPLVDPTYCDPAAFWDALIGQQDRHYGNYRFDVTAQRPPLGLIDNGYAFAVPTAWNEYLRHASVFVENRRLGGRLALTEQELDWVARLLGDSDLLNDLSSILADEQLTALLARMQRMANPPQEILNVLEF